jgi:hypothetical protein
MTDVVVLFCGDRDWTDEFAIEVVMRGIKERIENKGNRMIVLHGNATGADTLAGRVGGKLGLDVVAVPAKWIEHDRDGNSFLQCECGDVKTCKVAGPRRNREMLFDYGPNLVFAFHDDVASSRGTKDMIKLARKHNLPNFVIGRGGM